MLAGGIVLSEVAPADAGEEAGPAIPDAPEDDVPEPIELDGVVVSVLVEGEVDGEGDGALMGAGAEASSAFFPQAPSASSADKATAVATTDLEAFEYMKISL